MSQRKLKIATAWKDKITVVNTSNYDGHNVLQQKTKFTKFKLCRGKHFNCCWVWIFALSHKTLDKYRPRTRSIHHIQPLVWLFVSYILRLKPTHWVMLSMSTPIRPVVPLSWLWHLGESFKWGPGLDTILRGKSQNRKLAYIPKVR